MEKTAKIYIAGHTGLFGSALLRNLNQEEYTNIVTVAHAALDLTDGQKTLEFFMDERPDYVFCAAAKVGGIKANSEYMADFAMENLQITCNVIKSAFTVKVKKLLYPGAPCIYPRECVQPIKEEYLLTGPFEPTNEGYAIAKIAGVRLCDYYKKQYGSNFISCMPVNLYGPNDCYDQARNHVVPALIQRFHQAKVQKLSAVEIWGTGKARREFMYIDDAAEACIFLMSNYDGIGTVNIGVGEDTSIGELASLIREVVGYNGEIKFDVSKPDGMPKRIFDSSKIKEMGFVVKTPLRDGLVKAYQWFLDTIAEEK